MGLPLMEIGENFVLKIYEYDFDKNGEKEIIVIYSNEFSKVFIEVFNYKKNFNPKSVGKFEAQYDIVIKNSKMSFPFGSMKIVEEEYEYKKDYFKKISLVSDYK
jgi:hypothetical protein